MGVCASKSKPERPIVTETEYDESPARIPKNLVDIEDKVEFLLSPETAKILRKGAYEKSEYADLIRAMQIDNEYVTLFLQIVQAKLKHQYERMEKVSASMRMYVLHMVKQLLQLNLLLLSQENINTCVQVQSVTNGKIVVCGVQLVTNKNFDSRIYAQMKRNLEIENMGHDQTSESHTFKQICEVMVNRVSTNGRMNNYKKTVQKQHHLRSNPLDTGQKLCKQVLVYLERVYDNAFELLDMHHQTEEHFINGKMRNL